MSRVTAPAPPAARPVPAWTWRMCLPRHAPSATNACTRPISRQAGRPGLRTPGPLIPHAVHCVEQYTNNPVKADHVGSKPGSDRCAVSSDTAPPALSQPGTRSSRICVEAIAR